MQTNPTLAANGGLRRPAYDLVVLAASAGGLPALLRILAGLPAGFPAALVVVQHRSTRHPSLLARVLARRSPLEVREITPGETLRPGIVYLAPPNLHAVVESDLTLALRDGRKIKFLLSSANPLFESAAAALGGRVIAVVLTGGGSDATDGVQAVKAAGGTVIAQDEATSQHFSMPRSAIRTGTVDHVLPLDRIAPALVSLVATGTYAAPDGGDRPRDEPVSPAAPAARTEILP